MRINSNWLRTMNKRHFSVASRQFAVAVRGIAASLLAFGLCGAVQAQVQPDEEVSVQGLWYDDSGRGAVKIDICDNTLCGKIVWLREQTNDQGQPLSDRNNPRTELRSRPICGLPVLGNLKQMSDGTFDGGWVYDPKVGKTYSVALQLAGPNTLQVTGYAGIKLLGKNLYWKRVQRELPSCEQQPIEADAGGGETLPWAQR